MEKSVTDLFGKIVSIIQLLRDSENSIKVRETLPQTNGVFKNNFLVMKIFYSELERGLVSMCVVQKFKLLLRIKVSNGDLIAVVTKTRKVT